MAISVQNIIDAARQRTDKVASTFLTDATELLEWCRHSMYELYDLLVSSYGEEFFMSSLVLTHTASDEYATLSAVLVEQGHEIYKLLRVDYAYNSVRVPLKPFQWSDEILDDTAYAWEPGRIVRYRLAGRRMYFTPRPSSAKAVKIYYVPTATTFSSLTNELNPLMEMHSEYLITDLCIKIREKEDTDSATFQKQKQALSHRVQHMAPPRDAGNPLPIPDVRNDGDWWPVGSD